MTIPTRSARAEPSCSATTSRARASTGCVPGYKVKAGDAVGAYCQAYFAVVVEKVSQRKGNRHLRAPAREPMASVMEGKVQEPRGAVGFGVVWPP